MKNILMGLLIAFAAVAGADVTYTFSGQTSTFDGTTNWVQVLLNDDGTDLTMTVAAQGGTLKALSNDFGIEGVSGTNDQLDGTDEIITLTFSKAVDFISIDLAGVGGDTADGATLTVGSQLVGNLYTDHPPSPVFNGTTDVYTPIVPIRLNVGDSIVLTGASATSVYELEGITVSVIPEPMAVSLMGIGGMLVLVARRLRRS